MSRKITDLFMEKKKNSSTSITTEQRQGKFISNEISEVKEAWIQTY